MAGRVPKTCDGCGREGTAAPPQLSRPLGQLCGACLEKLNWIQPPGYSKPAPGAVAQEQKLRREELKQYPP